MTLEEALQQVVHALDRARIPYAILGGLAVRVYAIPRFTSDIDLMIAIERGDIPRLWQSLESAGCEIREPFRSGWLGEVGGLPLVRASMPVRNGWIEVDIFLAECSFQRSIMDRRKLIDTPAGQMAFASPEDLVLLKLIAGRPKDLLDVQDILFTMGDLDRPYMTRWADSLEIGQALQRALDENDRI
ncbi:MAG: DUF6036 family nucleotidyltransferase [Pirellulales bacterium]